jgi:hypothetical protein
MAEQQTLPGTGDTGGLWRRVHHSGRVDHAAWLRARAEGHPVGTCRRCLDHLMPDAPQEQQGRVDYTATCRGCGVDICAPGGRLMHRSGLWSAANGAGRAQALAIAAREEKA